MIEFKTKTKTILFEKFPNTYECLLAMAKMEKFIQDMQTNHENIENLQKFNVDADKKMDEFKQLVPKNILPSE